MNDLVVIRGDFRETGEGYVYKDGLVVSHRDGSMVRRDESSLVIDADVTGIDKIYFRLRDGRIEVSNRCKDFADAEIANDLTPFQDLKGYVPFPFTLLEGVWKAPPGLETRVRLVDGNLRLEYAPGSQLRSLGKPLQSASTGTGATSRPPIGAFGDPRRRFASRTNAQRAARTRSDRDSFRELFLALLASNAEGLGTVLSSFSGGFDSLLLTKVYEQQVRAILHFAEDDAIPIEQYRSAFSGLPWLIVDQTEDFDDADRHRYFESTDEPCCDPSGFAEYLMARCVARDETWKGVPIMNGQGADGLFGNGRKYHQAHVAAKLPLRNIKLPGYQSKKNRVAYGLNLYSMDVRARFDTLYYGNYRFSPQIANEIERVYQVYDGALDLDAANKLAALFMVLRYPLYEIEKIKTAARAFQQPYFLPLESTNLMAFAFAIPSAEKVGFRLGKKVLVRAFPEVHAMPFLSRDFVPQSLKARFLGTTLTEDAYRRFYREQWIAHRKVPRSRSPLKKSTAS